MGYGPARWAWSKVSTTHGARDGGAVLCAGEIYSYKYRLYAPSDSSALRRLGVVLVLPRVLRFDAAHTAERTSAGLACRSTDARARAPRSQRGEAARLP